MFRRMRKAASVRGSWPLAVLILGLVGLGCSTGPSTGPDVRVAAASDLQAAFPALAEGFRTETGRTVEFVPGASGQLARQIAQGAPFDVFLSADRGFVEGLARAGALRPGPVRSYATGSLVLAVYRDANVAVGGLDDLARPEVKRIAIANPDHAPYGRAAKTALEHAGLWERVRPKIVQAESVRQALQFVRTGNAEVGLVGLAIADVPEIRAIPIDGSLHEPIDQALGVIARRGHAEAAESFARFLIGEAGQGILKRYGFHPPQPLPREVGMPGSAPR